MAMYNSAHFQSTHYSCWAYRYRLELMRHIYNAESPPSIVDGASVLDSGNHETLATSSGGGNNSQLLQCITDCANASRLSLINLLPSRFGITKYFQCFFFKFLRCYFNHFSRTIQFEISKICLLIAQGLNCGHCNQCICVSET